MTIIHFFPISNQNHGKLCKKADFFHPYGQESVSAPIRTELFDTFADIRRLGDLRHHCNISGSSGEKFRDMMFFDPPHYRKRNLQKRTGFLNDFKSEGMDRRVFRLSRIDRTEIQVGGTLCLRLQCLFSGMGRAADDQVRGKSDRLFQRKIVLPDMDAVRAGQEGDVEKVEVPEMLKPLL